MRPAISFFRALPRAATRTRPGLAERIPTSERLFHPPRTSILTRHAPILARAQAIPSQVRYQSTNSPAGAPNGTSTTAPESRLDRDQVPTYELTFTCKPCGTRSSHRVSHQGYHNGTVLISCPSCKNRHLISDHLKIFSDERITLEDIMREKGNLVKRGTLSTEGDVEFWDDGTSTSRSAHFHPQSTTQGDPDAPQGTLTEPPASQKAK